MVRSNSIHGWRCNCVQNFLFGWFRLNYATNERRQLRHESELHCSHIHEQVGPGKRNPNFLPGLIPVASLQTAQRFPTSRSSHARWLVRKENRGRVFGLPGGSLGFEVTILLSPGEDFDWPARIDMPGDNPMSADLRLSAAKSIKLL